MLKFRSICLLIALVVGTASLQAQGTARRPLTSADIGVITHLLMLEDTRRFDETVLADALKSSHPEVRRRAAQAVGRIANPAGRALLVTARADANAEVVATVALSSGQLKDPESVVWLAEQISSPRTPATVAREAARSLGKILTPQARAALASYLAAAPATGAAAPVVGEALLSIGRFNGPGDLAPIVRWTAASSADVRWRAAWALFRLRDPASVPHLLKLSNDVSPEVRFWAVRGLVPPAPPGPPNPPGAPAPPPSAGPPPPVIAPFDRTAASARLRAALKDPDRRVRTEALRALGLFNDDDSYPVLLAALESPDPWLSVSAAEAIARVPARAAGDVPRLVAATAPGKPAGLRITALGPLVALAPEAALEAASAMARDASLVALMTEALSRLGAPGRATLNALAADPATAKLLPAPPPPRAARPGPPARPEAEYRALVERWIVPDYKGMPRPRAILETARGTIEIELYAGDAPLGLEYLARVIESGEIVGTAFGRLVPNFVAQQRPIRSDATLRDEVNRHGLTRGNLSWASAGLDTGRPGYTLGNTPQPHNEGNFTSLGRVIRGMEVVDRLELGDTITGARLRR